MRCRHADKARVQVFFQPIPRPRAQAFTLMSSVAMRRKDPAGDPAGHRLPVVGCLGDRSTEDGDVAVVVAADQPGYTYVQDAGVPGDGQVCESSFDVVTDPAALSAALSAARAAEVDGHRVAVQVGDVAGVGGVVDAQAEFGGSADRVGDEVRGRGRRDGRVRHGSWSD